MIISILTSGNRPLHCPYFSPNWLIGLCSSQQSLARQGQTFNCQEHITKFSLSQGYICVPPAVLFHEILLHLFLTPSLYLQINVYYFKETPECKLRSLWNFTLYILQLIFPKSKNIFLVYYNTTKHAIYVQISPTCPKCPVKLLFFLVRIQLRSLHCILLCLFCLL